MKKSLHTLGLVLALIVSLSTSAFAVDVPTVDTGTETLEAAVCITKELQMAEGLTIPNAEFRFEVTPITSDAPSASIAPILYPADGTQSNQTTEGGLVKVTQSSPIVFDSFPHAGLYIYTVKETTGTYTGEGTMQYDQATYTLRVYVANKEPCGLYIQTITAETDATKQPEIRFINTYAKTTSLTIRKDTQGALANKQKNFSFTIQFTNAATSDNAEFVGRMDGAAPVDLHCPVGQEISFTLKDGQTLSFDSLPVGTRYVVIEQGEQDGYLPNVTVTENGQITHTEHGTTDAQAMSSVPHGASSNLVGEQENHVHFVNAHQDTPITGLTLTNLPFLMIIGITLTALATLLLLKRRPASHE